MGYMPEKPVSSIKIGNQKSLVVIIPHYIHNKKNGIAPYSPWFYWIIGLYAFPKNQRAESYTIHKKRNGICVVKTCKLNGFKSFLKAIFYVGVK